MLHIGGFSSKHAWVDPWSFGSGARPLVAAAPWRVCRDVDLAVLGKWIAAAGVHFQVDLVDSWRHYRSDARDLLELNRIVLDRLDTGLRRAANDSNRIEERVWIRNNRFDSSSPIGLTWTRSATEAPHDQASRTDSGYITMLLPATGKRCRLRH